MPSKSERKREMEFKEREISVEMKAAIQSRVMQAQAAEQNLRAFLQGCIAGMGLDGDWNLNMAKWTFQKAKTPENNMPKDNDVAAA